VSKLSAVSQFVSVCHYHKFCNLMMSASAPCLQRSSQLKIYFKKFSVVSQCLPVINLEKAAGC
jgi:hypothetical protein